MYNGYLEAKRREQKEHWRMTAELGALMYNNIQVQLKNGKAKNPKQLYPHLYDDEQAKPKISKERLENIRKWLMSVK